MIALVSRLVSFLYCHDGLHNYSMCIMTSNVIHIREFRWLTEEFLIVRQVVLLQYITNFSGIH